MESVNNALKFVGELIGTVFNEILFKNLAYCLIKSRQNYSFFFQMIN